MERVLRLHPSRGFYMAQGLHLMNPEKSFVVLREGFEVSPAIIRDIQYGTLIDVNKNIVVDGKPTKTGKVKVEAKEKPAPKTQEPVEEVEGEETETKGKKTKTK